MKDSIVRQKSYDFALKIIELYLALRKGGHFELAAQVVKAGTSIGANIEEALAGQSKKDFTSKMNISLKEARETNYWMRLLKDSKIIPGKKIQGFIDGSEELVKILTSIVKTSKAL